MTLPKRQTEVARLVALGRINKEIAGELGLSVRTVEHHRNKAMHAMGWRTPADVCVWALRTGLISLTRYPYG